MFFDFIPYATGNRPLPMLRASCLTLEIKQFKFFERKVKRPAVELRIDTSDLSGQCSATEQRQPDNHQTSQSSICTEQGVLNASG